MWPSAKAPAGVTRATEILRINILRIREKRFVVFMILSSESLVSQEETQCGSTHNHRCANSILFSVWREVKARGDYKTNPPDFCSLPDPGSSSEAGTNIAVLRSNFC